MPDRSKRGKDALEGPFGEGLGRAIKVLRTGQDLSRKRLAARARISYSYLAEIENGAKSPSSSALVAIARGLGIPAHELVEAADYWRSSPGVDDPSWRERLRRSLASSAEALPAFSGQRAFAPDETIEGEAEPLSALVELGRIEASVIQPSGADHDLASPLLEMSQTGLVPRPEIPPSLFEEIRAGSCVAFVGAGFSAAANLPAWGALLEQVAKRSGVSEATRLHIASRVHSSSLNSLDEAAQVLEDQLGRERFMQHLAALLGRPNVPETMARRIQMLHGIPFRAILTTNFDGLLHGYTPSHEAYREALRSDAHRWWEKQYWDGEGALTLKLHGDLSGPTADEDSIVLTRRDYRRRLYEDPAYTTFLRAVMATSTVLYMGFSFEDAYLNELRSEILALLGQRRDSAPVAYAIVNDVPPDTVRHFRHHEGIEILSYDSHGGSDFSGFDALLESIHDATNPLLRFARFLEHRRILWIDPHPQNNNEAFEYLEAAARRAAVEGTALVTVNTADRGLEALQAAEKNEPFDLVITHWGERAARNDAGKPTPAAERVLRGIREHGLSCPVIIFASSENADRRKQTALGLGAQAYCFSFAALYQSIERVLAPAEETG